MKIPTFLCTFAKAKSGLGILQVQHRKNSGWLPGEMFFLNALNSEEQCLLNSLQAVPVPEVCSVLIPGNDMHDRYLSGRQ